MNSIRSLSMALLAITCLALVACGGGSRDPARESSDQELGGVKVPEWVADPGFGGVLGAVGTSRKSLGGYGQAINTAAQRGRTELARTIQTKVQAAFVSYFQEGGEAFATEDGPVYQTMATEMAEDVQRQLTNQLLDASRRKDIWEHPKNEEIFAWMIIDPAQMDLIKQQIKTTARQSVARRSNVAAELKTKEALDRLDAAIDKELERQASQM